ncbi:hypothetical protein KKB3_01422 [Dehalococcoides mccartyi]|nr:hypothetical protein KKB3_01422 [Dehalococcoides mccartyi]
MRRLSDKMKRQIANERKLKSERTMICGGLCEECHGYPDWRGLSLSHTKAKGMGGTSHVYTVDEVRLLCYKCHSKEHGITEV